MNNSKLNLKYWPALKYFPQTFSADIMYNLCVDFEYLKKFKSTKGWVQKKRQIIHILWIKGEGGGPQMWISDES